MADRSIIMTEESVRAILAADYLAEQRETRKFERWIRRVSRLTPTLATRVFALRGVLYMGCGFHWSMEHSLGLLIVRVNDFENGDLWHGKKILITRAVVQVCARMLFEQVAAAERSAWPDRVKITRDLRAAQRRATLASDRDEATPPDRAGIAAAADGEG